MVRVRRAAIPSRGKTAVLVANGHTCCICRNPGFHVQIHHVDGNRRNNAHGNLAVVCLNHHSRLTGDEGLGQRFSQAEVLEYKRQWEAELASSRKAREKATRDVIEWSQRFPPVQNGSANGNGYREYAYIHPELSAAVSMALGLPSAGDRFEHESLEALIRELEATRQLLRRRPDNFTEYEEKPFALERLKATKVFFPPGLLKKTVPSLREMVVWVSEPEPQVLGGTEDRSWKWDGTFLYLIGSFWQDGGPGTFYSGCSALQIIANVVRGEPFLKTDFSEPFGRRSFLHPVEKLSQLGGIAMDLREYEVLYRSRYMSDEQRFADGERAYRVHDLIAYPLFVANIF